MYITGIVIVCVSVFCLFGWIAAFEPDAQPLPIILFGVGTAFVGIGFILLAL